MKVLTVHDRAIAYMRSYYGERFPDSIPWVSPTGRWLYGNWNIGSLYANESRYDGAYPRTYLGRLLALFPEIRERDILHVFSGGLPKSRATRLDLNPDCDPELLGNVYELAELLRDNRPGWRPEFVAVDPPYSVADAKARYATPGVNSARVMRVLAANVDPGAHVAWLSTAKPLYRKDEWAYWGRISIERSTGHRDRSVSLFTRRQA